MTRKNKLASKSAAANLRAKLLLTEVSAPASSPVASQAQPDSDSGAPTLVKPATLPVPLGTVTEPAKLKEARLQSREHIIEIEDYEFSVSQLNVCVGEMVLFRLHETVPLHVEHQLIGNWFSTGSTAGTQTESVSDGNAFEGPLLNRDCCTFFRYHATQAGEIAVACTIFPELSCIIVVEEAAVSPGEVEEPSASVNLAPPPLLPSPSGLPAELQTNFAVDALISPPTSPSPMLGTKLSRTRRRHLHRPCDEGSDSDGSPPNVRPPLHEAMPSSPYPQQQESQSPMKVMSPVEPLSPKQKKLLRLPPPLLPLLAATSPCSSRMATLDAITGVGYVTTTLRRAHASSINNNNSSNNNDISRSFGVRMNSHGDRDSNDNYTLNSDSSFYDSDDVCSDGGGSGLGTGIGTTLGIGATEAHTSMELLLWNFKKYCDQRGFIVRSPKRKPSQSTLVVGEVAAIDRIHQHLQQHTSATVYSDSSSSLSSPSAKQVATAPSINIATDGKTTNCHVTMDAGSVLDDSSKLALLKYPTSIIYNHSLSNPINQHPDAIGVNDTYSQSSMARTKRNAKCSASTKEKHRVHRVYVEDYRFRPSSLTIEAGDAVEFVLKAATCESYSLVCAGLFDSESSLAVVTAEQPFRHVFASNRRVTDAADKSGIGGKYRVMNEVFNFMRCDISVLEAEGVEEQDEEGGEKGAESTDILDSPDHHESDDSFIDVSLSINNVPLSSQLVNANLEEALDMPASVPEADMEVTGTLLQRHKGGKRVPHVSLMGSFPMLSRTAVPGRVHKDPSSIVVSSDSANISAGQFASHSTSIGVNGFNVEITANPRVICLDNANNANDCCEDNKVSDIDRVYDCNADVVSPQIAKMSSSSIKPAVAAAKIDSAGSSPLSFKPSLFGSFLATSSPSNTASVPHCRQQQHSEIAATSISTTSIDILTSDHEEHNDGEQEVTERQLKARLKKYKKQREKKKMKALGYLASSNGFDECADYDELSESVPLLQPVERSEFCSPVTTCVTSTIVTMTTVAATHTTFCQDTQSILSEALCTQPSLPVGNDSDDDDHNDNGRFQPNSATSLLTTTDTVIDAKAKRKKKKKKKKIPSSSSVAAYDELEDVEVPVGVFCDGLDVRTMESIRALLDSLPPPPPPPRPPLPAFPPPLEPDENASEESEDEEVVNTSSGNGPSELQLSHDQRIEGDLDNAMPDHITTSPVSVPALVVSSLEKPVQANARKPKKLYQREAVDHSGHSNARNGPGYGPNTLVVTGVDAQMVESTEPKRTIGSIRLLNMLHKNNDTVYVVDSAQDSQQDQSDIGRSTDCATGIEDQNKNQSTNTGTEIYKSRAYSMPVDRMNRYIADIEDFFEKRWIALENAMQNGMNDGLRRSGKCFPIIYVGPDSHTSDTKAAAGKRSSNKNRNRYKADAKQPDRIEIEPPIAVETTETMGEKQSRVVSSASHRTRWRKKDKA